MAQVLEEFLVSLGYKVDEGEHRRFFDHLSQANTHVTTFAKQLTGVFQQFQSIASTAAASASSILAATLTMASGIGGLAFQAERLGLGAEKGAQELDAMGFAFKRIGGSAEQGRASLASFVQMLQQNPGRAAYFGLDPNADPAENMLKLGEKFRALINRGTAGRMMAFQQGQAVLGMDPNQVMMLANPGLREAYNAQMQRTKEAGGLHAETSKDITQQLTDIQAKFTTFGRFLYGEWADDIDHGLKRVSTLLDEWTPTVKKAFEGLHDDIKRITSGQGGPQHAGTDLMAILGSAIAAWSGWKLFSGVLSMLLGRGVPGGGGGPGAIGSLLAMAGRGAWGLTKFVGRHWGVAGTLGMLLDPNTSIATDEQERQAMSGGIVPQPPQQAQQDQSVFGRLKTWATGRQAYKPGMSPEEVDKFNREHQSSLWNRFLGEGAPLQKWLKDLAEPRIRDQAFEAATGGARITNASYTGGGLIHRAAFSNAMPDIAPAGPGQAGAETMFGQLESALGLPPGMLDRVWAQESNRSMGGRVVSSAGAMGPFQFMAGTARRFGVNNPFDLKQSATGASRYLQYLLGHFHGNTAQALAGYNAGEGNVDKAIGRFGGDWLSHLPNETQNYVSRIMRGWSGGGMMGGGMAGGRLINIGETHIVVNGVSDPNRAADIVNRNMSRHNGNMLRHLRSVTA